MLRTTSAEWTPCAITSAQAASTAGSPSVSTAVRMSTICRLPSSAGELAPHALPFAPKLTEGQAHVGRCAHDMLDALV